MIFKFNKIIFIQAPFEKTFEEIEIDIPTGEIKKTFWGSSKEVTRKELKLVPTGVSDSKIDGKALSIEIEKAIADLNKDGFELVSITPISSGTYSYSNISSSVRVELGGRTEMMDGGGWGYGFSYTSGVLLLGKKSA